MISIMIPWHLKVGILKKSQYYNLKRKLILVTQSDLLSNLYLTLQSIIDRHISLLFLFASLKSVFLQNANFSL